MICAASYTVDENGCMTVNAIPMWPEGVIADIVKACMDPDSWSMEEQTGEENRSEEEILVNWLLDGVYVSMTD